MAINVKGGSLPPSIQQSATARGPAANAYRRLAGKRPKKAGEDPAADAVAAALDSVMRDAATDDELDAARSLASDILDNPPPGTGGEQATAIAEQLKKKLEASRDERGQQARAIQERLDRLDE